MEKKRRTFLFVTTDDVEFKRISVNLEGGEECAREWITGYCIDNDYEILSLNLEKGIVLVAILDQI